VAVDLVNQRQVAVALAPGDLVDPDGTDAAKILVGTAPNDGHLHLASSSTVDD
jgi:hypothetical protein